MKSRSFFVGIYIVLVSLLFIMLFVYAAISKILDFENFNLQIGLSPILGTTAGWMPYIVLFTELATVVLLIFKRTRMLGLFASFSLMYLFTLYIYIMLTYSSYLPCSCGGILEKMTWKQHLLFNSILLMLSGLAYLAGTIKSSDKNKRIKDFKMRFLLMFSSILFGSTFLIGIFSYSEHVTHYKNRFNRRFPQHIAEEIYKIDLQFNSYYFAGSTGSIIYFGNSTSPLTVLSFDTLKRTLKKQKINLKEKNLDFSAPKVRVFENTFYVFEGSVPYIFQGTINDWNAALQRKGGYYFSKAEPTGNSELAVRFSLQGNNENALGIIRLQDSFKNNFNARLLQKQIDGIIDTDGTLVYNKELGRMIYVYYYRNEYLGVTSDLKLDFKGRTIDTISRAHIELAVDNKNNRKTFSKPPLTVNRTAASYGNLLFVNSLLPGPDENEMLWKTASIIDVYDLTDQSYRSSFPIYFEKGKKMKSMLAYGNFMYVLIDDKLICYKLRNRINQR